MKTTKRFDEAEAVLYKAFNEGTLNANDCTACAVGNMCNTGNKGWNMGNSLTEIRDKDSYWGGSPKHEYYKELELFQVERVFLKAHQDYALELEVIQTPCELIYGPIQRKILKDKQAQFNGLMAVLNYLAELDNIETIDEQYSKFKVVLDRETIKEGL
jgi:hypothetical protein